VPGGPPITDGVFVTGTSSATATINNTTIINNDATAPNSLGVDVVVDPGAGNAIVTMTGTNSVTTTNGGAVLANNRGSGNATVTISGTFNATANATTNRNAQDGVEATTQGGGDATVDMSGATGTINVNGGNGVLIDTIVVGGGDVLGTIGSGMTINVNNVSSGALGFQNSGIFVNTLGMGAINLTNAATINTFGPLADGIRSRVVIGNVTIANSGPITTAGDISNGIDAISANVNNPGGALTITNSGSIQTSGATSNGIVASKATTGAGATGAISISNSGSITTFGTQSAGILATTGSTAAGGAGDISILNDGVVTTSGANSDGLRAIASGTTIGNATITTSANVTATGNFSAGISAFGNMTNIVVGAGANILGGWQADLTSVGTNGNPSAGVAFSSRAGSTLINDGTIGALSDRAVFGDAVIINNGTITGFIQLTGVNDVINNNIFNFRHFADTNGDGVRDTLRVAVSDLGTGPSTFTNNGTLALPGSPGATTLDSTGQYLPLGMTFNSMALGGPVQGQILGATTFTNSGTIDLQANPVPGDVLLISGGRTPGTTGGGTFISNGGRLLLDTVLNEGVPNSQSDVLVVDGTAVGAGGATRLFARNVGGAGAFTPGNGILVVQSVDPSRSVPGVFTLGAPAVAGPFEYTLFLGGRGADATNGNWYLRSSLPCPPPPPPPPPPPTPSPPPPPPPPPACPSPPPSPPPEPPSIPNFRQEVSLYAAIPSLALLYGRNLMDTLHERVGEEEHLRGSGRSNTLASGAWGRIIGQFGQRDGDRIGIFGSGPQFDYSVGAFQVGQDFLRWDNSDGSRDHAGLYVAAGLGEARVQHFTGVRAGDDKFSAASFGGYWTHFGPTGWYVDAIAQGTWYDMRGESTRRELSLSTDGLGFAGSLEAGQPIRLGNGFFVEPQAQVVYQTISFEDARDLGATVRFRDVDSLAGRIGVRIARTFAFDAGPQPRLITAWLRPNLWREFRGDPKTEFSSETGFIPFHASLRSTWFELNAGFSGEVAPGTALYANGSYNVALDGDGTAYTGKAGLRVSW
jgi:autotransporter family porin